jgi:hypothetical protein
LMIGINSFFQKRMTVLPSFVIDTIIRFDVLLY